MTVKGCYIGIVSCWHKLYGIHVFRYYLKDFVNYFMHRIIIYNTLYLINVLLNIYTLTILCL